jgi:hypothetical protein
MPPLQGWMGGEIIFFYNRVIPSGFLILGLFASWRKRKNLSFSFYNHIIPWGFLILRLLAWKNTKSSCSS